MEAIKNNPQKIYRKFKNKNYNNKIRTINTKSLINNLDLIIKRYKTKATLIHNKAIRVQ